MCFLESVVLCTSGKIIFYKMKGDVGMSGHEKERKQKDAYTKIQNSFITPSLHLCSALKFLLFVMNALGEEKHLHIELTT